jgi:DNA polymerase I-like protein with 3'-5' exonuclease and polymerase domains
MNPRSSQQVAKIMGMRDGTGADKLAVLEANGGDRGAMATLIRQARVESKYNSTYLKKMVGHGRWYGHFAPSTRSGRLASKDNNLQNLPRKMKKFIGFSQIDDKVIVSADFAQLEMRTVACIADDKKMIKLFVDGEDLHGYMADVIFCSGYTKAQRNIAKVANFSLLYGASAKTFAAILLKQTGIAITEQEAQKVKSKWLATFKGVANWQQAGIKSWRAGNYNWTPLGRKYKAKMMTDYLNIQNQGAGGEVAKLAFNRIMKGFSYRDSYMINFVHDSFLAECPNDPEIYEAVAKLFVKSMVKAWEDYITVHPNFASVPMPTEAGVALTWADADGLTDECFYTYKEV